MAAFILKQLVQFIVVNGERGFTGDAGAKHKLLGGGGRSTKGFGVHVNPIFAVFATSAGDPVTDLEVSELAG